MPQSPLTPAEALTILRNRPLGEFDPVRLAGLRRQRQSELQRRIIADPSDLRAREALVQVSEELEADPYTGAAEQARTAQTRAALDAAALFQRPEITAVRREQERAALARTTVPEQIRGEAARDVARIRTQGETEQAKMATLAKMSAPGAGGSALPAGLQERIAGARTALDLMKRLGGELYHPRLVGPVAGRMKTLQQQIPLVPSDPAFDAFDAQTATLVNSVIKAITGAQMSEPEAVRIMRQVPLTTNKPGLWEQRFRSLQTNLEDLIRNIEEGRGFQGAPVTEDRLRRLAAEMGLPLE
jgi:hypothetical protein